MSEVNGFPALFETCHTCRIYREAVAALVNHYEIEERLRYTTLIVEPGMFGEHKAEELNPRNLRVRCTQCGGTGTIPTAAGKQIIDLVNNWQSREKGAKSHA